MYIIFKNYGKYLKIIENLKTKIIISLYNNNKYIIVNLFRIDNNKNIKNMADIH